MRKREERGSREEQRKSSLGRRTLARRGKKNIWKLLSPFKKASPSLPLRPRPFQAAANTHRRAALGANLGLGSGGGSGAVLSADGQPDAYGEMNFNVFRFQGGRALGEIRGFVKEAQGLQR